MAEVIFDGAGTQGLASLLEPGHKYGELVTKALQTGVLKGACPYCARAFQVKETLDKAGIPFIDDPTEHPDLGRYVDDGYEVLTLQGQRTGRLGKPHRARQPQIGCTSWINPRDAPRGRGAGSGRARFR